MITVILNNMANFSNEAIVKLMYKNFAEKNMEAVFTAFDKDVVWLRPGSPVIPFAGTFRGYEGLGKMFTLIGQCIQIKSFIPQKFCSNENTVTVLGTDTAEVIATGKTYTSDWVQAFTLKEGKIIHTQVFMDTLVIANAFQS